MIRNRHMRSRRLYEKADNSLLKEIEEYAYDNGGPYCDVIYWDDDDYITIQPNFKLLSAALADGDLSVLSYDMSDIIGDVEEAVDAVEEQYGDRVNIKEYDKSNGVFRVYLR